MDCPRPMVKTNWLRSKVKMDQPESKVVLDRPLLKFKTGQPKSKVEMSLSDMGRNGFILLLV